MDAVFSLLDTLSGWGLDVRTSLSMQWLGIALWQYVLAFAIIIAALFARRMTTTMLNRLTPHLGTWGAGLPARTVTAAVEPVTAVIVTIGVYLAIRILLIPIAPDAPPPIISEEFVTQSFQIAVASLVIWLLMRLVDAFAIYYRERAQQDDLPIEVPIISLIQRSLKIFVFIVGGLIVVERMGYPIASLLGGLGIGGLAIALAAQDTLSNIFGSVIVFADRPFRIGDWVRIGEVEGFVEAIGLRSTKIRTWPKSLVTVPNKVMANTNIENWSAMPLRRVSFTLYISYDATPQQLEALVDGIRKIVSEHPGIDQGYHLINFVDFDEKGFGVFIYYFTSSTVWKEHMQVRQEVNLQILRLIERLGLSLGVPNRYLQVPSTQAGTPFAVDHSSKT